MEDAHSCVLDLKPETSDGTVETDSKTRISFFGVYDGHGGDKVAIYAGENLHKVIAKQDAFKDNNFEQALKDGFLATDRAILNGRSLLFRPFLTRSDLSTQTPNTRKKCLAALPRSASSHTTRSMWYVSSTPARSQIGVAQLPLIITGKCWRLKNCPRCEGSRKALVLRS